MSTIKPFNGISILNKMENFSNISVYSTSDNPDKLHSKVESNLENKSIFHTLKVRETYEDENEARKILNKYKFHHEDELQQPLERYGGSIRINILKESKYSLIKSAARLLNVLKYVNETYDITPSYGLKSIISRYKPNYIPFIIEKDNFAKALFFYDIYRPLSTRDVYNIDKAVKASNINSALIISHKIGTPARKLLEKFKLKEIDIKYEYYDTLTKKIVGS